MVKSMKIICLLIIILLLCFIIFNTKKEGFNQVSNTSNSKEHFQDKKEIRCNLTGIDINQNIETLTTTLADNIISNKSNCTYLDLKLFKNLTEIGESAFADNEKLTKISFPPSITKIGRDAFIYCNIIDLDLSKTKLTEIEDWAFAHNRHNKQLTTISLPPSITTIGVNAFYRCYIKDLNLSDNIKLTEIRDWVFALNSKLQTISLPPSITKIGPYAFFHCNIETLDLSNTNLTEIGNSAFHSNKNLTTIFFPQSITTIGADAFKECPSIKKITVKNIIDETADTCPDVDANNKAGNVRKRILASLDEDLMGNIECTVE